MKRSALATVRKWNRPGPRSTSSLRGRAPENHARSTAPKAFSIAVDFPSFPEHNPLESPLQRGRSSSGSVIMYYPPPLLGRSVLAGKKVLLVDGCQATREVRAAVLRSHGVEVHAAEECTASGFLLPPNIYVIVRLLVTEYFPCATLVH